jgi:lysophospholipase
MDSDKKLTAQQIEQVRLNLQLLTFDCGQDRSATECEPFTPYCRFYDLDFSSELPAVFHAMGKVETGGYHIACHYWLPDGAAPEATKGTVLILHGYFDHVGLYNHLIRYLLELNYAVVAFDLPGHGLSDGERASIKSFDHYVQVLDDILNRVKMHLPGPLSAVGQSTGGAILLKRIVEQGGEVFERVVLLAPLVEPAKWWLNRVVFRIVHRYRESIPRKFLSNSNDQDFLDFLAEQDPLQDRQIPIDWIGAMKTWVDEIRTAVTSPYPLTIVQGTFDTTLSWRLNLKILRRIFPNATIRMMPGARHHMVNEAAALRRRIFAAMGFE